MSKLNEAGSHIQFISGRKNLEWGLGRSPRAIIRLSSILQLIAVSSSYFLLPFTYHATQKVFSRKVFENFLIFFFFFSQQNIQKFLTISNREIHWVFLSSNSCLKMTCFCSFQRAWIDSIVFLSKAHQRVQVLAGFLFPLKKEKKKEKQNENKAKNSCSLVKSCGFLHF